MRRHHHFFRFRLRAFEMAPSISTFALPTFSVTSSPFCSIWVTAGSCCTTSASMSWNSWASSIICDSIFWIASCLPCTARNADCDWPRRSLCRSCDENQWSLSGAENRSTHSLAKDLVICGVFACLADFGVAGIRPDDSVLSLHLCL